MNTHQTIASIVADRHALYTAGNNAGDGFAPNITERWTLHHTARATDDVAVYTDDHDRPVLVGTDGMGTDESRWAVRPE